MTRYARQIRPTVTAEVAKAHQLLNRGNPEAAFTHLERAHVLGQASTREHVRVHWAMLQWGLNQRDMGEVFGQLFRLLGALTKTVFGLVPTGNTGGSNVSPFKRMPVPAELQVQIDAALRVDKQLGDRDGDSDDR